ncbi:myoD family inhibitor-like [Erythrolamprus reginae]|uniref:myoD family inhibitor-like n=1 Tax=Erythrolamprus reginae TaxID=121349 RepID=UPI00396D048E
MSQVRSDLPSPSADSPDGEPRGESSLIPDPSTGQDTNSCPSSRPTSEVASAISDFITSTPSSQNQTTVVKEEISLEERSTSHRSPMNGNSSSNTESEGNFSATEAVTCQPQSRVTVQIPSDLTCVPLLQNGAGYISDDLKNSKGETGNGILCSELRSLSSAQKPHRKLQSHHSINSHISKKSKGSSKSVSSQIPNEAQEDCCVHCILSCLFCEFLTLCNIMLDCATCGSCSSEDSCICCCCCGSGECADCDLPCDMDCGIIDACCESADCLEICMECCGLCFSS